MLLGVRLALPLGSLLGYHKVMMKQPAKRKLGRPATGRGKGVLVRLQPPLLAALDKFAQEQDSKPSRPEAVRMILVDALISYGFLPLEAPPPIKADAN